MKLIKIDDIKDSDLLLLQKEFRKSKEIIHGCNSLIQASDLSVWRRISKN